MTTDAYLNDQSDNYVHILAVPQHFKQLHYEGQISSPFLVHYFFANPLNFLLCVFLNRKKPLIVIECVDFNVPY